MITETLTLQFDGGSRGNPGPAGVGIVIRAEDGTPVVTVGKFIGTATNNVAEYKALIAGLIEAKKIGATKLKILGDSELIIKQMLGEYRVKNADLKPLHAEATQLIKQFEKTTISHNFREDNTLADKLANLAMDCKGEVTDADDIVLIAKPVSKSIPNPANPPIRRHCPQCGSVITIDRSPQWPSDQLKPYRCACGMDMTK